MQSSHILGNRVMNSKHAALLLEYHIYINKALIMSYILHQFHYFVQTVVFLSRIALDDR